MNMPTNTRLSRRAFVLSSAAAGTGLALGFHFPAAAQSAGGETPEVNAWVVVQTDETCIIRVARAEMGQGTHTGLAQLVAEELDCDWSRVKVQMVSPGQNLARKRVWRDMSTGGSRGIRGSQDYMRQGGAAARTVLLQAAANQWGVAVSEVTVSKGVITHTGTGRKLTYGKVASAAAKLTAPDPKTLVLRDPRQWKIAGKPLKRVDTALKVMGKQNYAIDIRLPGMVYAAIQASPVFGGKLVSFDASKLRGRKVIQGVYKVDDNAVAVVADNWWRAKMALQDLPIVWNEGANGQESSATIDARLKEGLTSTNNVFADIDIGNAPQVIAGAAKRVEAVYSTPFVTHACMEPMNCTALITDYRAEVWVASQNAEASMAALSTASGLPLDKCEVHNHTLGGGFGRRGGTQDFVRQATLLGRQMKGVPVKMVWSREEDMAQDYYRPIGLCKLEAGLDAQGNLLGLQLRVSGQSINAYLSPQNIKDGKDLRQLQGLTAEPSDAQLGYTIPSLRTEYAMRNSHVPVGAWRGVNTNQNSLYLECFMEEVAAAAGRDPLEFRRVLMQKHPKHLAVLNAAADKAGWGKPLPAGVHRGIAQFMGYGSYSAAVAEVSVKGDEVKVLRLVLSTNCGHAVNPDQIAAQVEGSVSYAFDTLQSQSSVANGRMVNTNFDSYPIARLRQLPRIETVIAPTFDFWGGVGEPTICVVAPAILNAIFAATGKPMRNLPLKNHGLRIV
ncbi:MAG: molybdopterin-dependent oxidoreductase [Polaromonas sp.]|nr:molybdopterin-dependent oxidoreductase [Polaromonas sp.]